jgi:nucleoside 2-deoxyribosyltransferase
LGWRQEIKPELKKLGMYILDPTNKPVQDDDELLSEGVENHELRRQMKEEGRFDELHKSGQAVRSFDLRCVDKCDCIIACIDRDITMTGTLEEVFWANRMKKPTLIFCKQGKKALSDWFFWCFPPKYLHNNMEEVLEHLKTVDRGEEVDNKRWHFFNWKKIIEG